MGERVADLEEELQQASLVIVELEDELAKKNRLLAEHVRPHPHSPRVVASWQHAGRGVAPSAGATPRALAGTSAAPPTEATAMSAHAAAPASAYATYRTWGLRALRDDATSARGERGVKCQGSRPASWTTRASARCPSAR